MPIKFKLDLGRISLKAPLGTIGFYVTMVKVTFTFEAPLMAESAEI